MDAAEAPPGDAELLTAWLEGRSEPAFRALVDRHAGLVAGACRRQLRGDAHLAEDAAQSVFLILALNPSLREPLVMCFLERRTAADGPRQQIRFYDVSSKPILKRTFGIEGGAYAGPTPGLSGPDRFCGLTGVGLDGEGNLYVSTNGRGPYGDDNGFGAQLRKFDRSGKLLWMLEGLEFLDSADADPGDDRQVFTKDSRYEIEYGKATGEGWPHAGWAHRAWTVHRFKYPNDPRLHIRQEGVRVVRLRDGRRLLGC